MRRRTYRSNFLAGPVGGGNVSSDPYAPGSSIRRELDLMRMDGLDDMQGISRSIEREAEIDQLNDVLDAHIDLEREKNASLARITAPTSRAGYLVAGIVGLLLFWFITRYVFAGNRVMTGVLIIFTAIFFLLELRRTLEKKGARYIAASATIGLA